MLRAAVILAVSTSLVGGCDAVPSKAQNRVVMQPPSKAALADLPAVPARVVDDANLLPTDARERLVQQLEMLEQRTTDQAVVVTTRSLDGQTIEAFGTTLANRWGIGQRDKDNGVLIIVAPNERQTRISVGYGLESILTDERAQEIIDRDMLPRFRDGQFAQGIEAGAASIIATLIESEGRARQRRQ